MPAIQVHTAFGQIFEMKITVFFQELLSVVLTPFVLWFSLPACTENIIDFFREFTVHVEGVGYVCSFAVFDFKRHGNVKVSTACFVPGGSVLNRYLLASVWRSSRRSGQ